MISMSRIAATIVAVAVLNGVAVADESDPLFRQVLYRDAVHALEEQRPNEAIPLLRTAAEDGDMAAQRMLGTVLIFGESLFQRPLTAEFGEGLKWLRKAADQRDPLARVLTDYLERNHVLLAPLN